MITVLIVFRDLQVTKGIFITILIAIYMIFTIKYKPSLYQSVQ